MSKEQKSREDEETKRAKWFAEQKKEIDRLKTTIRNLLKKDTHSGHFATKIEETDFGLRVGGEFNYLQLILNGDISESSLKGLLNEIEGPYSMALSQEHNSNDQGGNYVESTQITIQFTTPKE